MNPDDELDAIVNRPPAATQQAAPGDELDAIVNRPPAVAHIQGRGRTVEAPPPIDEPSAPMMADPASTATQIGRGLSAMVEPFRPKNDFERAVPFAAAGRGAVETGAAIGKQTLQSVNDAVIAPSRGRWVDSREVYPFTGSGPEYTTDVGGVSPSERAAGAAQLGALAAAGPISGAVESEVAAPARLFLGKAKGAVAAKVVGGAAAGAPIGATYDPEHPVSGAATMAIVGGALAPLHATEHDVPVLSRPPEVREAVEAAQLHGAPDPDPVAAPVVEPPTSATPTGVTSQEAEIQRITEQRDQARREAETSPTTGQPNKLALQRALPAAEADPNTAIIRADINGLKNVNDAPGLGHHYADEYVLNRAAKAMKAAADEVGVPDRSFHPDGDQFVALVPKEKAEAYRDALERNYGIADHGNGVRSSISAGIGDTSPEADAEMYQRKAEQKAVQGITNGRESAPSNVAELPIDQLRVDPERFQFKLNTNSETGTGGALKSVKTYNPDLAGVLSVWKDPADGETYVVNGHHRYDLAKRAGASTVRVQYLDAPDARTARATGALINIAEDKGSPLDVAKFFKDSGGNEETLRATGVDVAGALVQKGLAISKLSDDIFQRVYKGEVPEEVAVGVGKILEKPEQQRAAIALIEKSGRTLSAGEISSVARQVRDAGSLTIENEDMFGKHDTAISLAVERARLAESFRKDFAKETSLFGFVAKEGRAEELAKAGNTIDVEGSKARATAGAQAQEMFDRLSTRSGPIADILTEGARRLAGGERIAAIKSDIGAKLRAAIESDVSRGLGTGNGTGEGHVPEGAAQAPHEEGTDASTATGSSAPDDGRVADSQDEHQAPLFAKNLFGEEEPDEPTPQQGGLFGEKEGTIDLRSTAQVEAAMRGEVPGLEYRMTHSVSETDRAAAGRRLAEIQRVLNRNEKISPEEIKTRIRSGNDTLFGSVTMDSRPVRSEEVPSRPLFDSAIPTDHQGDVVNPEGDPEDPFERGREIDTLRNGNRLVDSIKRIFSTATRSRAAEIASQGLREFSGQAALDNLRARHALKEAAKVLGKLSDEDRLQFIDDVEEGRPTTRPELQGYADAIRFLLDQARERVRELGTGKLEKFYRNYFPHIWSDARTAEQAIAGIMTKRSLEGPKSFLKKRSIVTMKDGIDAGLVPLTTNPVDLALLKIHEMNRYVMAQRELAELKARGLAKVVDAHSGAPEGWSKLDDKIGVIYGNPTTQFTEAYDKLAREKVEDLIDQLGFRHTRTMQMPGPGVLGYYERGGKIATRGATPLDVLYHEFGHGLDDKYGLWNYIREPFDKQNAPRGPRGGLGKDTPERIAQRKVIDDELRDLADQRWAGADAEEVSGYFKDYVRNRYEKMAVMVQAYLHAPELMRQYAPTVRARFEQFLNEHPDVAPLREVKPSLVYGTQTYEKRVKGMVIDGHIYVPDGVAKVMNNFLSPGLSGHPLYDAYRGVGSVLTSAQLGLSAFHLGFTALDATISKAALGIEQLTTSGQRGRALGTFARVPLAPIENLVRGDRLMKAALADKAGDPLSQIVRGVVLAGGRLKMDDMYKTGAAARFWKVLEDAQALQRRPTVRGVVTAPLLPARLLGNSLARVIEVAAHPIMEYMVPRMKLGIFSDMWAHELRVLGPEATLDEVRASAQKVWDSVDNRMGQLVYDNLFWHRATKDMAMASVRSVGWNLGTIREVGGGVADIASAPARLFRNIQRARYSKDAPVVLEKDPMTGEPQPANDYERVMTHRMGYIMALPAVVALYGSIYQYLRTGHGPQSFKDAFYPRTGNVNPDGTDERVQLPSYIRDIHAYAVEPGKTLKNKLNPAIGTIYDMLSNRDWQDNDVRNPDDPIVKQMQQEADFLAGQFIPFGIQNAKQSRERGAPMTDQAQAFVGVTPAPRDVVRAPWQQKMAEFTGLLTPGGLTPEQVEDRQRRRTLTSDLRTQKEGAIDSLAATMTRGEIDARQAVGLLKSGMASTSAAESFKRLTAEQAITVFKLMPEDVRDSFRARLMTKIANAQKSGRQIELPPELLK